jgi:hypothetical protein
VQTAIVGQFLDGFLCDRSGLLPLLGFAIGVDNLLVSANGVVVTKAIILRNTSTASGKLVLVSIDRAQSLEDDGAIVALSLRNSCCRTFRSSSADPANVCAASS